MFDVVLFQPEIPPNTGNAIRLCANTGARLHLVKPLGFTLEDAQLHRRGELREHVGGQARGLAAEHEHVARCEADVVGAARSTRRERVPLARAGGERRAARGEVAVHAHARVLVVVEARALHVAIVEAEAQRFDEMQLDAGIGGEPDRVAGVGRDLGMDQDDGEHGAQPRGGGRV